MAARMTMKMVSVFLIVLFFSGCNGNISSGKSEEKALVVRDVTSALNGICTIAIRNNRNSLGYGDLDEGQEKEVRRIVVDLKTSRQIGVFAECCMIMVWPEQAGDQDVDMVYTKAFEIASRLLSERTDRDAVDALESLADKYGRDGGESLIFKSLLKHQRELVEAGKTAQPTARSGN